MKLEEVHLIISNFGFKTKEVVGMPNIFESYSEETIGEVLEYPETTYQVNKFFLYIKFSCLVVLFFKRPKKLLWM
jgi:hypothetical protein